MEHVHEIKEATLTFRKEEQLKEVQKMEGLTEANVQLPLLND